MKLRIRRVAAATTVAAALGGWGSLGAQASERITRADAVARAVERGPRMAFARSDSLFARAQLGLARQFENPLLSLGYSKDTPQHHVGLDLPIDFPWLRSPRIGSAEQGLAASRLRVAFERSAIAYEADTAYTRAIGAAALARLSRRGAIDADSLQLIARIRRDAGDVSELDVQLATISAGQAGNAFSSDSADAVNAVLVVQQLMGLPSAERTITLTDTLEMAVPNSATNGASSPLVAAAEADVRAADLAIATERRKVWGSASFTLGFDTHDPGGLGNEILPVFGIALPFPLFNRNSSAVLAAQAQRDRAEAEANRLRLEIAAALERARRDAAAARARAARSQRLVNAAAEVSRLAVLAYREGTSPLASVLEAQRSARDAQGEYLRDLIALRQAAALVTLLETSAPPGTASPRSNP